MAMSLFNTIRHGLFHFVDYTLDHLPQPVINVLYHITRWIEQPWLWLPVSRREHDEVIARAVLLGMDAVCYEGGAFAHDGPDDCHWVCVLEEHTGYERMLVAHSRYELAKAYIADTVGE